MLEILKHTKYFDTKEISKLNSIISKMIFMKLES